MINYSVGIFVSSDWLRNRYYYVEMMYFEILGFGLGGEGAVM